MYLIDQTRILFCPKKSYITSYYENLKTIDDLFLPKHQSFIDWDDILINNEDILNKKISLKDLYIFKNKYRIENLTKEEYLKGYYYNKPFIDCSTLICNPEHKIFLKSINFTKDYLIWTIRNIFEVIKSCYFYHYDFNENNHMEFLVKMYDFNLCLKRLKDIHNYQGEIILSYGYNLKEIIKYTTNIDIEISNTKKINSLEEYHNKYLVDKPKEYIKRLILIRKQFFIDMEKYKDEIYKIGLKNLELFKNYKLIGDFNENDYLDDRFLND